MNDRFCRRLAVMGVAGLLGVSSSTWAGTFIWTGNGQAGRWNDPANWRLDGAVATVCPNLGDRAEFNNEAITADVTIEITDGIVLTGDGKLTISSKGNTGKGKNNNVRLEGLISGTGGLAFEGNNNGYVYITRSDNTYVGQTEMLSGRLTIVKVANVGEASSLGCPTTAANGTISLQGGNQFTFDAAASSVTYKTDRPLVLGTSRPSISVGKNVYVEWNGSIAGNIYVRGPYVFRVMNDYSGEVTRTDGGDLYLLGTANVLSKVGSSQGRVFVTSFGESLKEINLGQTSSSSWGQVYYTGDADCTSGANLNNQYYGIMGNNGKGKLHLTGKVGFNKASGAQYSQVRFTGSGDIAVDGDFSTDYARISKQGANTVVLNGNIASLFTTDVEEGSLYVNGQYQPASLPDTAYVNVTAKGTFGGSGKIGVPVKLATGATLTAGSSNSVTGTLDLTSAPLTLASGTKILFKMRSGTEYDRIVAGQVTVGGDVTVNVSIPNGVSIPHGTYRLMSYAGVSSYSFVLGSGAPEGTRLDVSAEGIDLVVPRSSYDLYTWVGDGVANAWNTTAANFRLGGVVTAWTGDDENVHFDDAGSNEPSVDIQTVVKPHLMTVDNTDKEYVFGGSGSLSGDMSLSKFGTAALTLNGVHDYAGPTLVAGGVLNLNGTLNGTSITVSNGCRLAESASGVIAGDDITIRVMNGRHELFGANTFTGRLVQKDSKGSDCPWFVLNNPDSLGRATDVYMAGGGGGNCGIALTNDVTVIGKRLTVGYSANARVQIQNEGTGSTAWYGDVVADSTSSSVSMLFFTAANGRLTIGDPKGGNVVSGKFGSFNCRGWSGMIDINSRLDIGAGLVRDDMGTVTLNAVGNVFKDSSIGQGTVKMGVAGAWCPTVSINLGKGQNGAEATFNLNGCDQTCGGVMSMSNGSGYAKSKNTVKTENDKPAVLTIDVAEGKSFVFGEAGSCQCLLNGPLSIVKKGEGSQKFGLMYNMTGDLSVEAGTLEIAATAAFDKAKSVSVSGGTLKLTAENAIGPATTKIDLSVTGGTVELGADQVVKHLVLNGSVVEPGVWGAVGSGADHESPFLTGNGRLTVRSGMGLILFVR